MSDVAAKHPHYHKDVRGLDTIDVYRVLLMFSVTDPCIQHAVKKLLVAGGRGAGKDVSKDIQEAIDSLKRWQEMRAEDLGNADAKDAILAAIHGEDVPLKEIKLQDLRVESYTPPGSGWAIYGKIGVRMTHIPTGVYACSHLERSSHANRDKAYALLVEYLHCAGMSRDALQP